MEQAGGYKQYLRYEDADLPRRSAYRYKRLYAAENDPSRSTDMPDGNLGDEEWLLSAPSSPSASTYMPNENFSVGVSPPSASSPPSPSADVSNENLEAGVCLPPAQSPSPDTDICSEIIGAEVCPPHSPSPASESVGKPQIEGMMEQSGDIAWSASAVITAARQPPQSAVSFSAYDTCPLQDRMAQPLFPGAQLTHQESLLLVMAHALRHHSSKEATESLLSLLQYHLPTGSNLPATKYLFEKYFKRQEQPLISHFYCPTTQKYIGMAEGDELNCPCGDKHSSKLLLSSGSYFLCLDWRSQLSNLLEAKGPLPSKPGLKVDVSDITESPAYSQLPLGPDDVTLTWNTDGVPVFHSSEYSVWPLEIMVNELPYKERINNVLLAGLWFGPKKPNMQCFLIPFVEEMNELSTNGFCWTDRNGVDHATKVYPGPCTVDTVARSMLHNQTQFNGEYGCCWCFHPGRVVEQGRGHARVYEVMKARKRNDDDFTKDSRSLTHGMLGTTVLSVMLFFSITNNTVVDYMHAVCLGVVRSTTNLWLKGVNSGRRFYLGRKLQAVNARLTNMTPPYEFPRLPRSLCQRKFWKATEWRAWLLYYSPFVLNGLLPIEYFRNWCRLGSIIHGLLADVVALDRIATVETEVALFMQEYQSLYGSAQMTFNVHLLSHLCDCVRQWGPLWGFSAFPFENMNGIVKKSFHGTQCVPQQICRKLLLAQFLPAMAQGCFNGKRRIMQHFQNLTRGYKKICNVHNHTNAITIGAGSKFLASFEVEHIRKMGIATSIVTKYRKALVCGTKYISHHMNKNTRINSVVYLKDGSFGIIESVFVFCTVCTVECSCEKVVYFFLQNVEAHSVKFCPTAVHMYTLNAQRSYRIVAASSVCQKCIAFVADDKLYACPLYRNMDY